MQRAQSNLILRPRPFLPCQMKWHVWNTPFHSSRAMTTVISSFLTWTIWQFQGSDSPCFASRRQHHVNGHKGSNANQGEASWKAQRNRSKSEKRQIPHGGFKEYSASPGYCWWLPKMKAEGIGKIHYFWRSCKLFDQQNSASRLNWLEMPGPVRNGQWMVP